MIWVERDKGKLSSCWILVRHESEKPQVDEKGEPGVRGRSSVCHSRRGERNDAIEGNWLHVKGSANVVLPLLLVGVICVEEEVSAELELELGLEEVDREDSVEIEVDEKQL
ncbi:hypothetical protein BDY19DRAFT_910299 [Irpex rosettiformis]|uniref:Uncharacterized protein n=1 Tax=Irpex rosettiformis TaxID=378272 RepID=A0ACB8TP84_9APHY|nr:hypothetical protein BDY19DRAFT_910299 [Irpex rosettiformis]